MTTDAFCYWLQGLMELQNPKTLDEVQVQTIKDHLNQVFKKVTPTIINKAENDKLAEMLKKFEDASKIKNPPPAYPQWPIPVVPFLAPPKPEYEPPFRVTCETNQPKYC